jgi:hypothetical protein
LTKGPALVLAAALTLAGGCASADRHPRAEAVGDAPPGAHVSDVCGDPDPIPRVRVRGVDERGDGLAGAAIEIRERKGGGLTQGKADQEGDALFALRPVEYTVSWSLAGFDPPGPVRVRAREGCEVVVVFTPRPSPR